MAKNNILTAEQEKQLRQPIEDYVGKIQAKLDELREDGTNRVVELQNDMDSVKRDHIFTQQEKEAEKPLDENWLWDEYDEWLYAKYELSRF